MPNEIRDLRTQKQFAIEHRFFDEYLPALGGNPYMLYCVYCRLASSFHKVFPSLRTIQKYTGFSRSSIIKYNEILEEFGLIKIEKRLSTDGDSENNLYLLLEPKPLPLELKGKYYPKEWEPILKSGGGPNFRPPKGVVQKIDHLVVQNLDHGGSENEPGVVQILDPINKDLNTVVNLHTTTIETLAQAALPYCSVSKEDIVVGLDVILKTALKEKTDLSEACNYVLEKINHFSVSMKKAANPLALLHSAVKNDWQDARAVKRQEEKDFAKRLELENQDRMQRIKSAWNALPLIKRAEYFRSAFRFEYYHRNSKMPCADELQRIITEFMQNGRYGYFNINTVPQDFKLEE